MDPETRQAWQRLGWSAATWARGPNPPSDSKDWDELSDDERAAAEVLGYNSFRWERDDGNPFTRTYDLELICLSLAALCVGLRVLRSGTVAAPQPAPQPAVNDTLRW